MGRERFRVVQDPVYRYRRLDPIPDEDEIGRFYQNQYYDAVQEGGRAPELRRLMAGGEEGERERAWLRAGLYLDICHVLSQVLPSKRVLDIGCGTGEFMLYLRENGFDVTGIEPSSDAATIAKAKGLTVYCSTLGEFAEHYKSNGIDAFDAITLLNTLEHVPDPVHVVEIAKAILKPKGTICVRVPNDFSEIQLAAQEKLNKDPWWIAIPDHINYFDFRSLCALLDHMEFEVIYSQGDFPMELFLLMGEDYVGDPDVGSRCHWKRVNFETIIPGDLRRRIYRALAEVGVGRDCLVFGRLRER